MKPIICTHCEHEVTEWLEFCPNCSEPLEGYSRPAGFWIRIGAYIIDLLVFIPIFGLGFWNAFSLRSKSTIILILISAPGLIYKPFMESFFGATLAVLSHIMFSA
jgi:hypothetical protein